MGQDFADDYYCDDRRRVVNAGVRQGRDAAIEDLRVAAEIGLLKDTSSGIIATRGSRLFLGRTRGLGRDQRPEDFHIEALNVIEIDPKQRIAAQVLFDPDDIDAAFEELDARYLAGEAAAHAHTWSVIAKSYASIRQQELPAISPGAMFVDHRRAAAFGATDLSAYIRAGYDLGQAVRPYAEAVHRLSDLGAVFSYAAHGVSHEGFDAEWQGIDIPTIDGGMVHGCEFFRED